MQQIRDLRCKTNDFLMDAESQTSLIFWQQPKSQEEMERQYYHTQLQFLDIRTQMLQEELVLLHMQRDYIVHEHKDLWQMTAQEIDDVIKDLAKKQKQVEEIQQKYNTLIAETPDTDKNEQQRTHYQYSMRLVQVRIQSITKAIKAARQQKYRNQMQSPNPPKQVLRLYGD